MSRHHPLRVISQQRPDGTPTQAGTFSFPMQVQDSQDNTANRTVPPPLPQPVPGAVA
jgi:hypothetical protein